MKKKATFKSKAIFRAPAFESAEQRADRLYRCEGGALIAWLSDEARLRKQTLDEMAKRLGVTYGYINQLRNRFRSTEGISHAFASRCADYLGVEAIVVKLLAGVVCLSDFSPPGMSESQLLDEALQKMRTHEATRHKLPESPNSLPADYKKLLVFLHSGACGVDVFHTDTWPGVLARLQAPRPVRVDSAVDERCTNVDAQSHRVGNSWCGTLAAVAKPH